MRIVKAMRWACPGAASIGTISPTRDHRLHRARDLGGRVGDGQPAFGGDQRGELVPMALDEAGRRVQPPVAILGIERRRRERSPRGGDGRVNLLAAGGFDGADHGLPLPVNQEPGPPACDRRHAVRPFTHGTARLR
jgi:hypothetical protein